MKKKVNKLILQIIQQVHCLKILRTNSPNRLSDRFHKLDGRSSTTWLKMFGFQFIVGYLSHRYQMRAKLKSIFGQGDVEAHSFPSLARSLGLQRG